MLGYIVSVCLLQGFEQLSLWDRTYLIVVVLNSIWLSEVKINTIVCILDRFNAVGGGTGFGLGSLLLELAKSVVALRLIVSAGSTFLSGVFWCVQLKGNVGKLQTHSNAKLVVKSNTCLLKFLIAKVISRRVKELQLLVSECYITILEHLIFIFLDKLDNGWLVVEHATKNGELFQMNLTASFVCKQMRIVAITQGLDPVVVYFSSLICRYAEDLARLEGKPHFKRRGMSCTR